MAQWGFDIAFTQAMKSTREDRQTSKKTMQERNDDMAIMNTPNPFKRHTHAGILIGCVSCRWDTYNVKHMLRAKSV